ncbi:MAG: tRNA uridine-5-carboxymethylaminomethyl(34) synthesis enzyme MnmG [Candidatus Omnitrophota bacterium]
MNKFDVIVIGAGHAGIEAALAAGRIGVKTALVTLSRNTIGLMSCNPAIGGVGKGQLVKEVDALGGQMAKSADACAIQFRLLNASKGAAVHSSRAQIDRSIYQKHMEETVAAENNISIIEKEALGLIVKDSQVLGVEVKGEPIFSKCVVITTGTFLRGKIHIGLEEYQGGRRDEPASISLSSSLKNNGLELRRLKTCTPPRLDGATIDFSRMEPQPGDLDFKPFSFSGVRNSLKHLPCYLTYTNQRTHQVVQDALGDKELFHMISQGVNPRYCPSIEEKVTRFPEKQRHQLFMEPEGLDTDEYYANGLFTFLPREVQEEILTTIPGLENARISKPGYGIEYDFSPPTQLSPSLETKKIRNLFLAGQINGTTGYEEAAAQGIVAGINAAARVKGEPALILNRSTSYIGVLIDDLVTKGTNEPYRMFTSRVEYRLIIREDNADLRLRKFGFDAGLVSGKEYQQTLNKQELIQIGLNYLKEKMIVNNNRRISLYQLLKRPGVKIEQLKKQFPFDASSDVLHVIETEVKYSGFIQRQISQVRSFRNLEKVKIPLALDYKTIPGISNEIKQKLGEFQPLTLGQASRISGITPAAIAILMVWLRKQEGQSPCLKTS